MKRKIKILYLDNTIEIISNATFSDWSDGMLVIITDSESKMIPMASIKSATIITNETKSINQVFNDILLSQRKRNNPSA